MNTKQLFKSLEAANFISKQTGIHFYIAVDFIDTETHVSFSVENINDHMSTSRRFHNWNEFVSSIAAEYTDDVRALVEANQKLAMHADGIFTLANHDICRGVAFRFFIYRE